MKKAELQRRWPQRKCSAPAYHSQYQLWSSNSDEDETYSDDISEPSGSFNPNNREQVWNESGGSAMECTTKPVTSSQSVMNNEVSASNEKMKESAEDNLQCSICDKMCSQKGLLKNHLHVHGGSRTFICSICSKGFKSKDSMLRHQITHSGAKPFPCDACGKGFSSAVALREHKARHDKQTLYECNICGRGFRQNSCFRRHLTIHTNKKPFECNHCKKCFSRIVYLHSHMLTHTGDKQHSCKKCGKMFAHLSDLNRHKIIHTGERPYKCTICDASFADPSSRRRHERDHDGKKSFLCQSCGETFKRSTQLKSHFAKKHTSGPSGNSAAKDPPSQASETFIIGNVPSTTGQQSLASLTVTNQLIGETIIVTSNYQQTVEKCIADSTVDSIASIPQMLDAIDQSITSENNPRYAAESNCNARPVENHSLNMNDIVSHSEQVDYTIYPDFSSQDYYSWLSGFTSICKLLPYPIDIDIFTKISQVSKSIADALASPSGILSTKENFKVLLCILSDLQQITTGHLNYVFDQLQS